MLTTPLLKDLEMANWQETLKTLLQMSVIAKESKEKNILFSVWIKKIYTEIICFLFKVLERSSCQQGYMNCATEK